MIERTVVVAAAGGIGDILRITPLIRVLHQLSYAVDVFLTPDYAGATSLLEGAPEIRNLLLRAPTVSYDVAVFTYWASRWRPFVSCRTAHQFDRRGWLQHGDSWAIEKVARQLGWSRSMPAPFAMASDRDFALSLETVALHPGCKPGWPWKKWHGFDELAQRFKAVAVIGTAEDLSNHNTYFGRDFHWPDTALNLVGRLSLRDTAALIRQCAALVSNDSGIMHLGVAVGTPTFGIFGLTSPQREAIPATNMLPITKGLDCEPACRRRPWGRRDCERHLECMKTLTADDVHERMAARIAWI